MNQPNHSVVSIPVKLIFVLFFVLVKVQAQLPTSRLPYRNPLKTEFSKGFFNQFSRNINRHIPSLGSFIICQNDTILYEQYFHGGTDTTLFNVKSVTKSILSALAGIAQDKKLLPGLATPVLEILSEYKPRPYPDNVWFSEARLQNDSLRQRMTLKDLLTMQTGLQWDDFGPVATAFVMSSDPVRFMLDLPFTGEPGQTFNYCSGASSIFGAVLSKLVKTDLKEFAHNNLFHPIGVQLTKWDTDPAGRYVGASEIYLCPQDLVKFGLLLLHKGVWDHTQVVSSAWINETWAAHATLNYWSVLPNANGYGYYWWRRKSHGHQCYVASGAGGQLLCVVPDLDMVIATTCFLNEKNRGRSDIKLMHSYIDKIIGEATTK